MSLLQQPDTGIASYFSRQSVPKISEPKISPVVSKLDEYKQMYGECGILTARLVDPLSELLIKVSGLGEDEMNAIGFYYEAEFHGVSKMTVILFNTYDNDPIPWLRLGYTMELLLGSPFVTKIAFYPMVNSRTGTRKLEEIFRATVIQTINLNAKAIHDKNLSYTALLLRMAGITGTEVDRLTGTMTTGYSLVNTVLLKLMQVEKIDPIKIASSIIPCPLLRQPITITAPYEIGHEFDLKYIIEESRREITKLVAIFVDLFTSHQEFRSNLLSMRMDPNHSSQQETDLITYIVDGIRNGVISNATLNQHITALNEIRPQALPLSLHPQSEVKIIDDTIMCTFQQPTAIRNLEPLQELGNYLEHITAAFHDPEILTINLETLIALYNATIKDTSLRPIIPPDHPTLSRLGMVTLSNQSTIEIPFSETTIAVPMYNCNLTPFTDAQLLDMLIYIDSLRSTDGTSDHRFSNLQNEITHELARRRRQLK